MSRLISSDRFVVKWSPCLLYSNLTGHYVWNSTVTVIRLPITKQSQHIVSVAPKLAVKTLFQKVYISLRSFVSYFFRYERSKKSTYVKLTLLEVWMDLLRHVSFCLCILVVNLWRDSFRTRSLQLVSFGLVAIARCTECAKADGLWMLLTIATNTRHKIVCQRIIWRKVCVVSLRWGLGVVGSIRYLSWNKYLGWSWDLSSIVTAVSICIEIWCNIKLASSCL
jgi:hypothetical protein